MLDPSAIQQAVPLAVRLLLVGLQVLTSTASTNAHALTAAAAGAGSGTAIIALKQTQGRGRQNKVWLSPPGNLYLSLLWRYPVPPQDMSALSLAVGVALAECLAGLGVDCRLKWPNDVLVAGRKLGGVLVETKIQGEAVALVVGVGVNRIPSGLVTATDLHSLGVRVSLATLAGQVLGALLRVCSTYAVTGFAPWRTRWSALDAYAGLTVTLHTPQGAISGLNQGVGEDGALYLASSGMSTAFHLGEVSLRPGGCDGGA